MPALNPYIDFAGRCRDALDFYARCFDGRTETLMTYGNAPMDMPADARDKVMHAEFRAPGIHFMATDGCPGGHATPPAMEGPISLALQLEDPAQQDRIFAALADSGEVAQALQDTFWGARFGMVRDRFGIHWMLNCQRP
ncbi:VOC family protein [Coralloluteibacterium stylophorae]|uniref:VOC family protein n=1 Tax=Coralloluteibacterium stylophorae TaxID=1776034 RepID=A0A8J7VT73_9GAMM|nr:VOC family protein [Coralloluteibacterium stylophorae]MBS7456259.1 VOC family protein [Coralloluteibacterium stylophorae]